MRPIGMMCASEQVSSAASGASHVVTRDRVRHTVASAEHRRTGVRVRFDPDGAEWPLRHLNDRSFSVAGTPVPAGTSLPVQFVLSPYFSITLMAQSVVVDLSSGLTTFAFAEPGSDVVKLVVSSHRAPGPSGFRDR